MARILVFQHVPYEGPASIADWATTTGHEIQIHEWYQTPEAPSQLPDLLIVMGGPMNVDDDQEHPWLATEKTFIQQAIDTGIPVLGICLGAQLIAAALGKKVYPNTQQELGWLPLSLSSDATGHPVLNTFPVGLPVFHWHGDTFDLPDDAILLGSTEGCMNQGFAVGKCVGLQFHLEIDHPLLQQLINQNLLPEWQSPYVHHSDTILKDAELNQSQCRDVLFQLLDRWSGK